jgi:hypothetical protein
MPPGLSEYSERAIRILEQLQAHAIQPVPRDFRVLLSTLYYYDLWVREVIGLLELASAGSDPKLERIKELFAARVEPITAGNGLYVARETQVPEQGSYIVPNLNITIIPLIYGDNHSWNTAYLQGEGPGVPAHRHQQGVEIHLGFSPIEGRTILGDHTARVREGYAMPIPPMTYHGFENLSGHDHFVPFIFGSLTLGGWGVFFDVEPRAGGAALIESTLGSADMNYGVLLEQEISRAAALSESSRKVVLPAFRTGAPKIGGLELGISRIDKRGLKLQSDQFRIISVRGGSARVAVEEIEVRLEEHDHLGIPSGLSVDIAQIGGIPLTVLDATIQPTDSSPECS